MPEDRQRRAPEGVVLVRGYAVAETGIGRTLVTLIAGLLLPRGRLCAAGIVAMWPLRVQGHCPRPGATGTDVHPSSHASRTARTFCGIGCVAWPLIHSAGFWSCGGHGRVTSALSRRYCLKNSAGSRKP